MPKDKIMWIAVAVAVLLAIIAALVFFTGGGSQNSQLAAGAAAGALAAAAARGRAKQKADKALDANERTQGDLEGITGDLSDNAAGVEEDAARNRETTAKMSNAAKLEAGNNRLKPRDPS